MKIKTCNKCKWTQIKKDGKMNWKQRYKCKICGYVFQNKSRDRNDNLRVEYTLWKQTYQQLSCKYWKSIPTIQKRLDKFLVKKKI
jgi:transposase-like protein